MVSDLIPDTGTNIRVDGATSFQSLQSEAQNPSSLFHKLGIKLTIGRLLNKNKNPTAENANKEILKEILRHTNRTGPITPVDLAMILRNVNSRVRYNGLTSKEILFRRNLLTNKPIPIDDEDLCVAQSDHRKNTSKASQKSKQRYQARTPPQIFLPGQLVFLRDGHDKNSPRETYIVEEIKANHDILIRKLAKSLRPRLYTSKPEELVLAPGQQTLHSETNLPKAPERDRPLRRAVTSLRPDQYCCEVKLRKSTHRFGWNPEDQDSDDEFPCPQVSPAYSNLSTSSEHPTTDDNSDNDCAPDSIDEDSHSSTETDLTWDLSPEQFQLMENCQQPTTNRNRAFALSEAPLIRSNAFRRRQRPPDTPPVPVSTPPSRIPRPTTPTSMDLQQVADISLVAPLAFEPRQVNPTPENTIPHPILEPKKRGRSTKQPQNYRVFHRTGYRGGRQERQGEGERGNKITQ